jgi:hypothetical protein
LNQKQAAIPAVATNSRALVAFRPHPRRIYALEARAGSEKG